MAEVNLLQIRYKTVENLISVIKELIKEFPHAQDSYERILEENCIVLNFLGKKINIPYYNKIAGNIVNLDQKKQNPIAPDIYDKYEYKSLSKDEIREIILNKFVVKLPIEEVKSDK